MTTTSRRAREIPLVLIIDDVAEMSELLSVVCQRSGYEAITAARAEDGIEKALIFEPDVILMDMFLPTVSGRDATQALKQSPRTRDIPVVLVTGYPISEADLQSTQAVALLRKPFAPEELVAILARTLAPRGH